MTDRTHPDSGSIITSSDILLHDAETALLYEELRAAIDDGHESMTHADALAEIAAIREENEKLHAQLEAIGAGGVSGPLIGRASLSANAGEPTEGAFQRALSIRAAQGWKLGGDKVPVLYTDEINGEQVCRDDLWLCTTAALAAPPTAQAEGWTKLPGQLPEPGMPVLLDIGKKYPIRAMWAAKHTVQAADDDTDWGEYVEADDMYYAPEGWYEWNQCEENHWRVTETPRAWMPLPPTSAEGVEHG